MKLSTRIFLSAAVLLAVSNSPAFAQEQDPGMWDKASLQKDNPNLKWFKEAKFGMFIHWGLYSKLAGEYKGKRYYGSGEWIMNQGKIPAADYAKEAKTFNPVNFNAEEWARIAKDAGIKYMVITAKHHEGFAMYDSKVSDFNIVKATSYGKDPMKALAEANRKQNIPFGFYYSQFIDWHEPNGGKNGWDFDESKKDYQKYYREKAIPQLKELLTGYGPLGIVWFDMPGGLTKVQTQQLVDSLHQLQPKSLFSSRVGQGLGDYRDFGDSEIPDVPIKDAVWESIYTHNDSWGYIKHDMNFKSSEEIIRLLARVASKGGNLMLNVGPDGLGNIPPYSVKYLLETGAWLKKYGESIYGSDYGLLPPQPWGVTTSKPGREFLHVFNRPSDGRLLVPGLKAKVTRIYDLETKASIKWRAEGDDLYLNIPEFRKQNPDEVFVVEYSGKAQDHSDNKTTVVSPQYEQNSLDAVSAQLEGKAEIKSLTYSHYYGDWKHTTCVVEMKSPSDAAEFKMRLTGAGDYKVILEYACSQESAKQEGKIVFNGKDYLFRTLRTSEFDKSAPLMFIKHTVAIISVDRAGLYSLKVSPLQEGKELFKLKSVWLVPIN
jgi:alpha-L-fucosidase